MECYDLTMNFLGSRKGKMIKVLIEGGGLKPLTARLLDFDDAVMVLGMPDGDQWIIDMAYVMQVADAKEVETPASTADAE